MMLTIFFFLKIAFSVCTTTKDLPLSSSSHWYSSFFSFFFFYIYKLQLLYDLVDEKLHHFITKKKSQQPPKKQNSSILPFQSVELKSVFIDFWPLGRCKEPSYIISLWRYCHARGFFYTHYCKHRTMLEILCVCVCVHEVITPPPGSLAANASQCLPSGR